jgi:hypothetical protein
VQLEHSGDVVCKLKNHLGEATCRAKLRVNEDLSKKGEIPLFVEQPSNMEVMEGSEARFECVISGTPEPEVIWYFNGRELFVRELVIPSVYMSLMSECDIYNYFLHVIVK